ncbi:MAG TPA: LacI family DNA-binding transcriptional regulator [bacterium]|nr:LacI family DNA-binding transcriptional regulator [bacterium]
MRRRVTLKDVARKSGLAVATVSAICRGKGDFFHISRKTQERVLRIAEKMGYRRNSLAFSLRTGSSNFVAVLGRTFRIPVTQERQNFIAQLFIHLGFQALLYDFHWFDGKEEELLHTVEEIPCAGMVVSDVNTRRLFQTLRQGQTRLPCVLVDSEYHAGLDHVYLDRSSVSYLAASHLLKTGYTRIVYTIPVEKKFWLLQERRRGFVRAMAEAGRQASQANFLWVESEGKFSYQIGLELGEKIATSRKKPEAVMALNDQIAIGLMRGLQRRGLRVPEDIALVGSENLPEGEFC